MRLPNVAGEGLGARCEGTKGVEQRRLATRFAAVTEEVERRETAPKGRWLAAVSTEGGGLGSPSLYLGGHSAMRQPWSYAPVRHDVVADAETQNRPADVEQGQAVQDGWERAILDAQQRRAEQQDGWEHTITAEQQREAEAAAAEADAELDDALAAFEAEFNEFKNEWAEDHGASVGADGTLLLPADQYEALAAEWEEDYEDWWNTHSAELNASYANYGEAVALELRLAALEAESQGEDPNQAVSDQADEIRDGQDQTAVDAIDAAEEQVLGETQAVRAAQVDYAEESQDLENALDTLESAEALPDNLSDKPETVTAAEAAAGEEQAEVDEAAVALEAAVAEQMEDLGQEVLVELGEQLGVTAPNADHYRPGELPQTLADLSDEELAELIQEALGQLDDPESVADVIDALSEDTRNELATALGVEPDELAAVLSDPGQLAEALGTEDEQAAIDALADQLIGMVAGEVSEAHGNNSYIDALLFGSDDSPGVVDQVAVDLQAGELGRIIEGIDPAELSGVEKELWEAGDQVSVALLRQLGVSFVETQNVTAEGGGVTYAVVDGVRIELGYHEQRLLGADPVALALLLKSGFRIEGIDNAKVFTITLDGDAYDMAGLAEEADAQARLAALATQAREDDASLATLAGFLWRSNAAGLSQRDLMLLAAHDVYVAGSVRDQMEATDDVQERWRLYDDNVGATLTSGDLLWRETSDLLVDQGGYDDIVAGIVDDEANRDDLGGALADMLKGYTGTGAAELDAMTSTSPEHAAAILRAVLDNVDLDTLYDSEGTDAFFEQLSALVEIADSAGNPADSTSWAQEVADWWAASLEQRDGGSAGHLWNPETGYEFLPTTIEDTVRSGFGAALSEELASTLDGKGWWEPGDTPFTASFEQARGAYEEALKNAPTSPAAIREAYEDFESRKNELVPNYFDRIMSQEGIGEAQEVVYGDALRDLIAAGMDLDWRNNGVDAETVDYIMAQMFDEAGIDAADRETTPITVTVLPYIYAAERDGWATGALFAVDGPDTVSETVVYGGGYASTVTETDAHDFVIDGGVIANLARQAAANGTTIDAITKDQPWRFDSVKHFQDKNYLAEEGLLYLPYELGEQYGLDMELFASADNDVRVGTTAAAIETTGEKWMARADIALTVASVGAMLLPGGLALAGLTRAASATLWAARGTLLGSTIYSAARGAYDLNQMRGLGMDIGWSNRAARSTYVDMLGTAAGIGAMAGGRLTRELLDAAGPGLVTRAARTAYLGTQAGNLIDLGTGAWLSLDGLRQVLLAGDDAKARDWLMAIMGPAMLSIGGVGIVHESRSFNNHLNQSVKDCGTLSHPIDAMQTGPVSPRRGDLIYLAEGSVTVDGKAVDPEALEVEVSRDAFLIIAEETELPDLDRLVEDIQSQKDRDGQDIVLYGCGGSAPKGAPAMPGASNFTSLARQLANRLGARVHAVDGRIIPGETTTLDPDASAGVTLPDLPLTNIAGGQSQPQASPDAHEAQRRFWLQDGGREARVASPFDESALAQGARVNGQPIDPMTLGAQEEPAFGEVEPTGGPDAGASMAASLRRGDLTYSSDGPAPVDGPGGPHAVTQFGGRNADSPRPSPDDGDTQPWFFFRGGDFNLFAEELVAGSGAEELRKLGVEPNIFAYNIRALFSLSPTLQRLWRQAIAGHRVEIVLPWRATLYDNGTNQIGLSEPVLRSPFRLVLALAHELSHADAFNRHLINLALPRSGFNPTPGRLLPLLSRDENGRLCLSEAIAHDVDARLEEEANAVFDELKVFDELDNAFQIDGDFFDASFVEIYEALRDGELSRSEASKRLRELIAKTEPSGAPGQTYESLYRSEMRAEWRRTHTDGGPSDKRVTARAGERDRPWSATSPDVPQEGVPPSQQVERTRLELERRVDPLFRDRLVEYVRSKGGITFAEFMERSLYGIDGEGGYYSSGTVKIGGASADDFQTAPEMSPLFGRTIARALIQMYEAMGRPETFDIVEMGAGNGVLARDILEKLRSSDPGFYGAVRYTIVERSGALIARQRETLAGQECAQWVHASADALPLGNVRGVFLSNELVDAFPVHRAVVREGTIKEIYIAVDEDGLFIEVEREPGTALAEVLPDMDRPFPVPLSMMGDGQQLTVNARSIRWQRDVARALDEGYVLTIDYGQPGATWQAPYAFYRGRAELELAYQYPGAIDITSHVDHIALSEIGETFGLRRAASLGAGGVYTQREFLLSFGFGHELVNAKIAREERSGALGLLEFGGFFALIQEKRAPETTTYSLPEDVWFAGFAQHADGSGLPSGTLDAVRDYILQHPFPSRDEVTSFYSAWISGFKRGEVERAQAFVEETDNPAFFISGDIFNLGGLNKHMQDRLEIANGHYRSVVGIAFDAFEAHGASLIPMRVGGDEIAFIVMGIDEDALRLAIEQAEGGIRDYAWTEELSEIPHTKKGRENERGFGLHMGYCEILSDLDPATIFNTADLGVNESKERDGVHVEGNEGRTLGADGPASFDDLSPPADSRPQSLSAAYHDPDEPWPKPESSVPEIFRNPRARQTSGLPSPSELLEGYVSPARIDLLGGGDQPGGVPRSPVKEVDADALEPKQGAEVALGPVPKLDLSQRGLHGRDGPPRIKAYTAITFGCVVFAAFPEHWRVPIAASAYALRGAGFIAESMFPAAFAPDKRLGRALGGMYLLTWFPNIEEGFRHFGDNVFNLLSNVPNQIGNWTYAGKKLQELLTGKAAFQNTDKLTLPLYFFGSIPSTIQSVQAGSEAGILAGSLIASGSAYLWVKSVRPTERKLDERLVLAGTFGVGLLLTSGIVWKALLEDEDKDKPEPSTDNTTPSPADGTPPDNPGDIPVDPEEPQEPMPQLVVTAEDGLNLREEPAALSDRVAVLRPGSLVRNTGECKTDEAGNEWISVQGYGWDGEEHQGWVMASFVAPHARGAQSEEGRYNPELESQGYHWVEVEPGQTVGNIAREHSVDVAEMVVLNMDHIVDPTMIFAGDRVYLPAAA
ncbi:SAM-dependent methyltransferase [Mesorhizobium sp.]|uniref:SAM-dependent methyltransferase n=1 Tax=Mesorhizobium sp. TaxID=1871066 RepID=UPI000FE8D2A0|nr:SAM-dependent methyltransferase [Mesorhizobium sp.]RWK12265.1 MAG: DUF4781 domain-containing protein [Mesorhizobium sp.]